MSEYTRKIHLTARLLERVGVVTQGVSEKALAIYLYGSDIQIGISPDCTLHLCDTNPPRLLIGEKNVESFVEQCKLALNSPAFLQKYRGGTQ